MLAESRTRYAAVAAGALALVAGGGGAAFASSTSAVAAWCTPGATVPAATVGAGFAAATCAADDLTIVDGAAGVRLPARGTAVSASVLTTTGDAMLTVVRDQAGAVTVTREAPNAPTRSASACSSSGYSLLGYEIKGGYAWSYNPASAPGSVAGQAAATLKAATSDITSGRDDCGLAGKPQTSHRYLGTTGAAPNVSAAAQCAGNDGRSVSGWKSLTANGVLAVTCTYYIPSTRKVVASDAAINTRYAWTVSKSSCRNAFDLRGVMTHERGHTFGLGHSTADPGLTMYPSVRPCDFSKSTLGKGDLLGLLQLY